MKYTLYLELNFFSPISFFFFMNWSQFSVRHIAKCYLNLLLQYCVQQHNNLFLGESKQYFHLLYLHFIIWRMTEELTAPNIMEQNEDCIKGVIPAHEKYIWRMKMNPTQISFNIKSLQILTIFWFQEVLVFSSLFTVYLSDGGVCSPGHQMFLLFCQ